MLTDKDTGENIVLNWAWILAQRRHRADIAKGLLMGQKSDTTFDANSPALLGANGNAVQTTHGFDALMDDYGLKYNVASAGTVSLADQKQIVAKLTAAQMPTDLNAYGSNQSIFEYASFVKNLGGTGIPSARLEMGGKAADLDVEKIKMAGYTISFVPQSVFDSVEVSDRLRTGLYVVPSGVVPTYDVAGSTGGTGYINLRGFSPKAGGAKTEDQHTFLSYDGALADEPTGHNMTASTNWTSFLGFDMPAPQKTMRIGVL
jgi:hypothetical protein